MIRGKKPVVKPLVNICKVNTHKFRAMTDGQLDKTRMKLLNENYFRHQNEGTRLGPHDNLIQQFINYLIMSRYEVADEYDPNNKYRVSQHFVDVQRRAANRMEQSIWNAQVKSKCKISLDEEVVRDAIQAGDTEAVARLRPKRPLAGFRKRR